jgi:oxygen-independent coproporphyrinogen-3 oxidase
MLKPDLGLVEKYNKPGPRYTSYPTAPQFSDVVELEDLRHEASLETGPISLYFHIPFCQSLCNFCGCTKIISRGREPADAYLDQLEQEIDLYLETSQPGRLVQQLHFGGGTPNYLTPDQIDRFSNYLHQNFSFADDAEISAELDPRRLTEEHISAFRRLGVNRVSFGMQDILLKTQQAVNRVQSDEQNRQAIQWARAAGIDSLNIDLIYGLPYQTPETIRTTIRHVHQYDPDRLAIFSYAHVPWIAPAQKILDKHGLPTAEAKIKMLGVIIEELTSSGYQYIGMDHFAKVDDSLAIAQRNKTMQRNFQGYSTFKDIEICAFGISSISQTANSYRQNVKDLEQ